MVTFPQRFPRGLGVNHVKERMFQAGKITPIKEYRSIMPDTFEE